MNVNPISKSTPTAKPHVGEPRKTDLQAAVATVREMMPWRKMLYTELRRLALETEKVQGNAAIIPSNIDPEKNRVRDRNWAENMRHRVAGDVVRLLEEWNRLWAEIARFKDAHALMMKHAVPGILNGSDIGALSVTAISIPLTDDDPNLVARFYDEALLALAKLVIMTPPFHDLLNWVKEELKGKELAVVELVCESRGRLALAQLAKNNRIKWNLPCDNTYNNIQNKVNKKLRRNNDSQTKTHLPYNLKRDKNCAVIERFTA
jgi:hypothetical protein